MTTTAINVSARRNECSFQRMCVRSGQLAC